MKTTITKILTITALASVMNYAGVYADSPSIRLNNYVIDFKEDTAAEMIDGELFIPLRKVGMSPILCKLQNDNII